MSEQVELPVCGCGAPSYFIQPDPNLPRAVLMCTTCRRGTAQCTCTIEGASGHATKSPDHREWTLRRRKEEELWNRCNTKRGAHISVYVRLDRMLAEDIRNVRSHGLAWLRGVTGNSILTLEQREQMLNELEFYYVRIEAAIEKATTHMRENNVPIPRFIAERFLKPQTAEADTPAVPDQPPTSLQPADTSVEGSGPSSEN